jgi:diguanylate cyclase (GGDEF)-like protein
MALEKLHLSEALEARVAERTAALVATNRRLDAEVRARTRAEEQNRVLALTDDLTGLYNRRGFTELATEVRRSAASNTGVEQLVFIDIDGLKAVNDRFGHREGDRLLQCTAAVLRDTFGEEDILARIGGDEFTIYRSRPTADQHHIVDRIEAGTECRNRRGELAAPLALSIGVASANASERTTLDALLARSDAAMYTHKRTKRPSSVSVGRFQTPHARDAQLA